MGFIKKAFDFVVHPTHSRTMGILMVFVLTAVISLTVIASQERQTTKQRASAVCEDVSIQECPPDIAEDGYNYCATNPNFKCKVTKDNKYRVYGCVPQ